jgi:hypothetical protein
LRITSIGNSLSSYWNKLYTRDHPPFGLFNYGFGITERGKLIIHGGLMKDDIITRTVKSAIPYSDMWIINMAESFPNFVSVDCVDCGLRIEYGIRSFWI